MNPPFTRVTGPAGVLREADIDTDTIIRVDRYSRLPREELGPWAFESRRYREDGSDNPDWPLNRPPARGAPILIAGANFGCGSSREAAVWALLAYGVRTVLAPSFGGIFANNCYQNGLLPVALAQNVLGQLADAAEAGAALIVDLEDCTVRTTALTVPFAIDGLRRQALMAGLDDLGLTVERLPQIARWQQQDRNRRPWIWNPVTGQGGTT